MPSAPRAAPSNITVVPPSGTCRRPAQRATNGKGQIVPKPVGGIVTIPVKPWTFQTADAPFGPSYFASKYVKPPVPRFTTTLPLASNVNPCTLVTLELKTAAGHVPQLTLLRVYKCPPIVVASYQGPGQSTC